jgi:serine/threonine protein kinase
MGTVFDAEHITIGRSVAVKVLHTSQAQQSDAVRRFHREARAASCIGHPNICEVYDLDTLGDGSPYLVMEKLDGETLAHRIWAERKLSLYDLIDILEQVLSALIAAHGRGVVHRDIKPENVFLARRFGCPPLVKLLDFGVSKTLWTPVGKSVDDVELTRRGMVMGTPYYMSPEQARGDRDLDGRVDLYACGVILYEALTGHRPFVASSYRALLREVISAKPRPARELRRTLPSGFDAVLGKAMAGNRDHRYGTAVEFQRELQSLRDRYRFIPTRGQHRTQPRSVPPPPRASDIHEQPTRVWKGRLQDLDEETAPTRAMRRPSRPESDEDHNTIVRLRLPESLGRSHHGGTFQASLEVRHPKSLPQTGARPKQ